MRVGCPFLFRLVLVGEEELLGDVVLVVVVMLVDGSGSFRTIERLVEW